MRANLGFTRCIAFWSVTTIGYHSIISAWISDSRLLCGVLYNFVITRSRLIYLLWPPYHLIPTSKCAIKTGVYQAIKIGAVAANDNLEGFYSGGTRVMVHIFCNYVQGVMGGRKGASILWLFWKNSIPGPMNNHITDPTTRTQLGPLLKYTKPLRTYPTFARA